MAEQGAILRLPGIWLVRWWSPGYRLLWCIEAVDRKTWTPTPPEGNLNLAMLRRRNGSPRCISCDRTQPMAGDATGWEWMCKRCLPEESTT